MRFANQQTISGSENLARQKKLEAGKVYRGKTVPACPNLTLPMSLMATVSIGFPQRAACQPL